MTEQQSSYRQIIKATSLFGGVQVIKAITSIISSKVIAILLEPTGMGIYGLINTSLGLITSLTNFGLGTSAVKTISSLSSTEDDVKLSTSVMIVKRLALLTGLIGTIITLFFSGKISFLTFGSLDFKWAFAILSVSILFNQISVGQISILQGLRKHKHLANALITGSVFGLILSLPFYFFWGIKGIVPAILISSIVNLIRSWYFSRKIELKKTNISTLSSILKGKEILKMGLIINLSGIITYAVSYFTRVYIGRSGGMDQVGLYNAGYLLINGYVSLIFSAMATDYFPRLSACSHNELLKKTINEQAEILLLLLAPLIIFFFLLNETIIIAFYSVEFLDIKLMLFLSLIGMIFRAASWSISFVYIARGDAKIFFWNELFANIYFLCLNIYLYNLMGISGLGFSFLIGYFLYFIQQIILMKKKYNIVITGITFKILLIQLIFVLFAFIVKYFFINIYIKNITLIFLLISDILYSYFELNKRINISNIIKGFIKK